MGWHFEEKAYFFQNPDDFVLFAAHSIYFFFIYDLPKDVDFMLVHKHDGLPNSHIFQQLLFVFQVSQIIDAVFIRLIKNSLLKLIETFYRLDQAFRAHPLEDIAAKLRVKNL